MDSRKAVLRGYREIGRFLRISHAKAVRLADLGAPVVRDKKDVLRANREELWGWYKENVARV